MAGKHARSAHTTQSLLEELMTTSRKASRRVGNWITEVEEVGLAAYRRPPKQVDRRRMAQSQLLLPIPLPRRRKHRGRKVKNELRTNMRKTLSVAPCGLRTRVSRSRKILTKREQMISSHHCHSLILEVYH